MTETELNAYVKERFGTGLESFVRQKIEVEGVWDYEVADLLNVRHHYISRMRRTIGLDRTKGFFARFERKYGPNAISKFREKVAKENKSLTDVGNHFGFSREYARQVYQRIYNCSYRENHGKRKAQMSKKCKEQKKRINLVKVQNKMKSMGFKPRIEKVGRSSKLLVNGYRLSFKLSRTSRIMGKAPYFSFNNKKCFHKEECDFFVCLLKRESVETHFIIPQEAMPKCSLALSPRADHGRSKYSQFKEAWHLLKRQNEKAISLS